MGKDLSFSEMRPAPLVTVLMPVFNCEAYVGEAIESILNQSFRDFEFIVINDGSTDRSGDILARYERMDERVKVYHQENRGIISSLNRGCDLARGRYIARMDADDISLAERLAKQVRYMEAHPEIGVLGTWIEYVDENGSSQGNWCMPTMPALIDWSLFFGSCLAHPSVMMRRDVVEQLGFYRPEALHIEDYDLWVRASGVTRIANIPEILLQRRDWAGSICSSHSQIQEENVVKVVHSMIARLLKTQVSNDVVTCLRRTVSGFYSDNLQQIVSSAGLVRQLFRTYVKVNPLNRLEATEVARDAGKKFYSLAVSASRISLWKGSSILVQALMLNPQLLSSKIITKGKRILLRTVRLK